MRIGIFVDRVSQESEDISVEASVKEEVLLTELQRRYDLQQTEIETANIKAGIVLAYLGAVFFLLLDILTDVMPKIQGGNSVIIWLSTIAFLAYLASACCCILAIRPTTGYSPVATERDEIEEYLVLSREATVLQILVQYSQFIQQNLKVVQFKNRWLVRALILSLIFISTLVSVKIAVAFLP